jgi:hypothetical protein
MRLPLGSEAILLCFVLIDIFGAATDGAGKSKKPGGLPGG